MKVMMKVTGITLLALGMLTACGNGEEVDNNNPVVGEDTSENNEQDETNVDPEEIEENEDGSSDSVEDDTNETEGSTATGEFDEQLDLQIGDTGQVSTNIGDFELTIIDISRVDEVDNETSQLDYFYIADIKMKNIGEETMSSEDIIGFFNITHDLDQSGSGGDISRHFDSIEGFSGDIEPGEEMTSEVLFAAFESDKHFIRITEGSVAAGGVLNQVIWNFTESDLD